MSIVTAAQLIARMGGPQWTPEARRDAEALLVQLETRLEAMLNTKISPGVQRSERAPVSEAGLIVTEHPVAEVVAVDGRPVLADAEGAPVLPSGWALVDNRVRRDVIGTSPGETTFPSPAIYDTSYLFENRGGGLGGMLPGVDSAAGRVQYVVIVYRPGWGANPALQDAILGKAKAIMVNNHSSTITARQLEGSKPSMVPETWTQDEINQLGVFRGVPGPMTTRW